MLRLSALLLQLPPFRNSYQPLGHIFTAGTHPTPPYYGARLGFYSDNFSYDNSDNNSDNYSDNYHDNKSHNYSDNYSEMIAIIIAKL